MVKRPHRFHIEQVVLTSRIGLNKYEVKFEVRDLMQIYRILNKRKCGTNICNKLKMFLNSYADEYGYKNFKITDKISLMRVGVENE